MMALLMGTYNFLDTCRNRPIMDLKDDSVGDSYLMYWR